MRPVNLQALSRRVGLGRERLPARVYLPAMLTKPLSKQYGFERGLPLDRKCIELFLERHADAIHGRCLEVKENHYVRRFGAQRVAHCDIVDIDASNPQATIVADLHDLADVEDETFDCVVVTNTLQYLRDPKKGIQQLHRVLKFGGTLLATFPALGKVEEGATDYWRFMPDGVRALFDEEAWSSDMTEYGNALMGVALMTGMATRDVPARAWTDQDPDFPCTIGLRAVKRAA